MRSVTHHHHGSPLVSLENKTQKEIHFVHSARDLHVVWAVWYSWGSWRGSHRASWWWWWWWGRRSSFSYSWERWRGPEKPGEAKEKKEDDREPRCGVRSPSLWGFGLAEKKDPEECVACTVDSLLDFFVSSRISGCSSPTLLRYALLLPRRPAHQKHDETKRWRRWELVVVGGKERLPVLFAAERPSRELPRRLGVAPPPPPSLALRLFSFLVPPPPWPSKTFVLPSVSVIVPAGSGHAFYAPPPSREVVLPTLALAPLTLALTPIWFLPRMPAGAPPS